jgi:hypothetical protein
VDLVGIAAIPGNHDCNFSLASDVRPILIGAVAGNLESIDLGSDAIQQLLRIQSSFFDFEKEILALPAKREDQLAWQFVYPLSPTENILVRCLNTALASRIKEEPGQLFFPLQALGQTPPDVSLAITCFHHPYGWLEPINRRGMTTAAQEVSDIILTGHEHDPDSHTNIDKQFSTQYTAEQLSKYQQLPPERKVLIVDDWHKVQLGSDAKHNLLMDAGAHFGQVITFTSDTSLYQQMTIPDQGGALPGIEYCEIAQFGFRLRTEMIRKWQSIGQEFDNDDLELTKKFPLVNTY